ncbi:YbgC/FadM family acyl-CoA thioesterase [Alphaproteobacteria bacterium]|jgi:acyl-CoA thioester hydrolase|nr:YbgC/FadM family acyl-CoA thioesterase [Alphaproteobacteria bacterium]|tara:strand:- start:183 stop:575 length:393 start_codon:yes stop_codon:yes gene_type:complete
MSKFNVYYEDTDASGRVYHANYLKFLERSRTDLIYQTNYTHEELLKKFDLIFVVKECSISFKKPAFFEDLIKVTSEIDQLSRVKIKFNQKIYRESDLLVQASVLVIPVNSSGKISKLPNELYFFLEKLKI